MPLTDLPHLARALRLAELCEVAYDLSPGRLLGERVNGLELEAFRYHVSVAGVPLGLQGFLADSARDLVLVFCGSRGSVEQWRATLANWTINLAAIQIAGHGGRIHRGFALALGEVSRPTPASAE